jgi:DNA-binding transcriptional MerR regulator
MKIGELSQATGVHIETIRFYEREGLIDAPARGAGNYRQYETRHVALLNTVRRCRELSMSLDEVRTVLALMQGRSDACSDIKGVLQAHMAHVDARIRELETLRASLRDLQGLCANGICDDPCALTGALTAAPASPKMHVTAHVASVHAGYG